MREFFAQNFCNIGHLPQWPQKKLVQNFAGYLFETAQIWWCLVKFTSYWKFFLYIVGGCHIRIRQGWKWMVSRIWLLKLSTELIQLSPKQRVTKTSENLYWIQSTMYTNPWWVSNIIIQGTKISHLGKRNIIFKSAFVRDMLVPRSVIIQTVVF